MFSLCWPICLSQPAKVKVSRRFPQADLRPLPPPVGTWAQMPCKRSVPTVQLSSSRPWIPSMRRSGGSGGCDGLMVGWWLVDGWLMVGRWLVDGWLMVGWWLVGCCKYCCMIVGVIGAHLAQGGERHVAKFWSLHNKASCYSLEEFNPRGRPAKKYIK